MSTNNDNNLEILDSEVETQVEDTVVEIAETPAIAAAPAVKTKKELKAERKAIKKHKKEVKMEALKHSAKAEKFMDIMTKVVSIIVIIAMLVCSFTAVKTVMNLKNATGAATTQPSGGEAATPDNSGAATTPSTPAQTPSDDTAATPDDSADAPAADNNGGDATTPLGSKADVVEYFKTAHAKVLTEAKSVTRTYDNTVNYQDYLEVGGNSSLASVAKTLMNTFMKEVTDPLVYSGADIATNFPPTKNSCAGLTADMIKDVDVKEEGDNYIITLVINSSMEQPDLGDYSSNLVNIVESKTVEDAAAGFVAFTGLENRYFAPTVKATINKTTGQMTALEADTPSYMCFESATVMKIITVKNVGIGLEYIQKWTVEW